MIGWKNERLEKIDGLKNYSFENVDGLNSSMVCKWMDGSRKMMAWKNVAKKNNRLKTLDERKLDKKWMVAKIAKSQSHESTIKSKLENAVAVAAPAAAACEIGKSLIVNWCFARSTCWQVCANQDCLDLPNPAAKKPEVLGPRASIIIYFIIYYLLFINYY